jgi:hypothetical protein
MSRRLRGEIVDDVISGKRCQVVDVYDGPLYARTYCLRQIRSRRSRWDTGLLRFADESDVSDAKPYQRVDAGPTWGVP